MGNITNKAQKYLLNNKCADLLLNDNRTTRIEDRIYVSDIMMMFLRSEREQKESEQQSNCNLPHVSKSEGITCEAQLNAFIEWHDNLSIEELAWYEGRYLEIFKSI